MPDTDTAVPSFLTRERLLGADDVTYDTVAVPEWGNGDPKAAVRIRSLTLVDNIELEHRQSQNQSAKPPLHPMTGVVEWLLTKGCVDASGAPLLTASDVGVLSQRSGLVAQRVASAILRLTRGGSPDVAAELAAEKNG